LFDDRPTYCRMDKTGDQPHVDKCMCAKAYQHVQGFSAGERRVFLSKKQFSLVDVITAMTHEIGRCALECAVWTGTQESLNQIQTLVQSKRIGKARWILCNSQRGMNPDRVEKVVEIFGPDAIRVLPLHAKMVTLKNDDWSVVILTSANLTLNQSVEHCDVTDSPKLYDYIHGFFDEVFGNAPTIAESPPFDELENADINEYKRGLCMGDHIDQADPFDARPVGVVDGLK